MIGKALKDAALRKQLFAIAIPIAISGLAGQAQMLIDSAFIGHYSMTLADGTLLTGSDFFSALGNVFFPYIMSINFVWSLTMGTVVLVSQRLGAGKPADALRYAEASIKFMPILGILLYVIWLFIGEPVLRLMGVREPILGIGMTYLRTMSIELLVIGLAVGMGSVLDGQGITRPEMIMGIVRSLINVLLDWILIFGKFGFPEMGVAGAGLATSLSAIITTACFMVYFFRVRGTSIKPSLRGILRAPLRDFIPVAKIGLPTSAEGSLWNLGNLIIAVMLNALSPQAVGVFRLVTQVQITPIFFYGGLSRAVTILVGNRTGERRIPEAMKTALGGTLYTLMICVFFSALFIAVPAPILAIFNKDPAYIALTVPFLLIAAFTMFPQSFNVVSGAGIRGYGDTRWMLATQIFGVVFVVGAAWLLMFPLGLKLYGLFFALLADETIRGIVNTIRFYRGEGSIFHKPPVGEKQV